MSETILANGEVVTTPDPPAALVPQAPGVHMGILRADGAASFVAAAGDLSRALADVIRQQKLYSTIQGKDFVKVEGWTTLAAMLGVTPHEVSVVEEPEGVFTATVELRRLADGQAVGRASAECGGSDEQMWAKRPRNARRSMALTRATGKACRLAFSWIMTLAGYEATPAEEMDAARDDRPVRQPESVRLVRPQIDELNGYLVAIKAKHGDQSVGAAWAWMDSVAGRKLDNLSELPPEKFEEVRRGLKRKAAQEPQGAKP